jgi:hypothetical protein
VNAIASTGTSQVSLLAAFTLPVANAVPATPSFLNMMGLMLSSPNQIASPTQIADSMIRSMLGSPLATVPPIPVSTTGAPNSKEIAQLPPKRVLSAPGVTLPAILAAMPVQIIVASTSPALAPGDSKANVPSATTPQPVASAPAAPPANNSLEAQIAFTATLTPIKDGPQMSTTGSPIATSPEPDAGERNPSAPAVAAANPMQPTATASPQAQAGGQAATMPASTTLVDTDQQLGGDTPSQQGKDSPGTPARPAAPAPEKTKPVVQQDDNSVQAMGIASV